MRWLGRWLASSITYSCAGVPPRAPRSPPWRFSRSRTQRPRRRGLGSDRNQRSLRCDPLVSTLVLTNANARPAATMRLRTNIHSGAVASDTPRSQWCAARDDVDQRPAPGAAGAPASPRSAAGSAKAMQSWSRSIDADTVHDRHPCHRPGDQLCRGQVGWRRRVATEGIPGGPACSNHRNHRSTRSRQVDAHRPAGGLLGGDRGEAVAVLAIDPLEPVHGWRGPWRSIADGTPRRHIRAFLCEACRRGGSLED